jgi:hypothetical protein
LTPNIHSRLIGEYKSDILAVEIIFKACVVSTEDDHFEQPTAGSHEWNCKSAHVACV